MIKIIADFKVKEDSAEKFMEFVKEIVVQERKRVISHIIFMRI